MRLPRRFVLPALIAALAAPSRAEEAGAAFPPVPELDASWEELFDGIDEAAAADSEPARGPVSYGFDEGDVASYDFAPMFRDLSQLRAGEGAAAISRAELNRRIRSDRELIERLLRAAGYYDPLVTIGTDTDAARPVLAVSIDPGPLYTFGEVGPAAAELLGIAPGDPVDAAVVEASLAALRVRLPEQGYPFAAVAEPDITVDHESRTAAIEIDVERGRRARFGGIRITGEDVLSAAHIGRLVRAEEGDLYDAELVEDLRRALIATGLVGAVSITPEPTGREIDGDQEVRLLVDLQPAPMRTLAGQIGFSSTDGLRVEGSWQHRNLFPPEGALTIRAVAGTEEQLVAAELRRSNFRERDQILGLRVAAEREDRDAFFAQGFGVIGYIERETNLIWQKRWTYRVGPELLYTDERDRSAPGSPSESFLIAALHGRLSYDGTDDLLNPTENVRITGEFSPELSLQDGAFGYARTQLQASTYLPLNEPRTLVIAGRALAGTIVGADRRRIAPSRRFYAGGGGSVRGFGYQDVGPEDAEGNPLGGRSVVEFSLEARYRFGDFGVVPFIDAGQVYTSSTPDLSDLRFGVGLGARYHTRFGPIRVDFATPLGRREGEPVLAVYVSIGQAF